VTEASRLEADEAGGFVTGLALTPVKGTRLRVTDTIMLERDGVRENRRFYVIDARGRMLNGKQLGQLSTVVADYSDRDRRLRLTFPDGGVAEGPVEPGAAVQTRFFSRPRMARLISGPWSEPLSQLTGQELRLVEPEDGTAVDRGLRGAVSLISRASLTRLAAAGGEDDVDSRRFRMLIEVDGLGPHEEDAWVGRQVRIGETTIAFAGHVGRCLVTSRDPDTGEIDLPTLDILGSYRREQPSTEPLPFGIHGQVLRPGAIRVGDAVVPGDPR
jgi:uncharacterized protein YcbX